MDSLTTNSLRRMMELDENIKHSAYLGGISGFFEVLPGVNAHSKKYADMMWELADLINQHKTPVTIKNGIYQDDDLTEVGQLVQLPGVCATPFSQPAADNVSEVHPNFQYTVELLVDFIRPYVEYQTVRLNNTSTVGFPQLTNDRNYKLDLARYLISIAPEYLKAMSDAATGRRSHFSLNEYKAPIVYKVGRRLQSNDKVEIIDFKSRKVEAKSRRIRFKGKDIYQDRLFMMNTIIQLVAQRERLFQGMHNGPNTQLQFINNGIYHALKTAFSKVLVFSQESLTEDLSEVVAFVTGDIPRFDTSITKELVSKFAETIPQINQRGLDAYLSFLNCPVVSFRQSQTRVEPLVFRGDDLDIEQKNVEWYGLASGAGFTASVGKGIGLCLGIWVYEASNGVDLSRLNKSEVKQIVIENFISLSKNGCMRNTDSKLLFKNAGDNLGFIIKDDKYLNITAGFKLQKSGFTTEVDDKSIFAGYIAQYQKGKVIMTYRLMNYLTRLLQPETDIHRADRRLFRLGFHMRRELYKNNPSFRMVSDLLEYVLRKYYDFNIGGNDMVIGNREKTILGLKMTELNFDKVMEFIDDPSKILWKFDESSIPEQLLNEFYTPLFPEEYAPVIKAWTT